MATEISAAPDSTATLAPLDRIDFYEQWQKSEGVPVVNGFYIADLNTLELGRWERKGGSGAFVNRDLAEYLVPVQADIPEIDAIVLDSFDDKANALGAKGIGELSICGAGASIANAVFNATGVRVRDFPITLDKVLPGLPLVEV